MRMRPWKWLRVLGMVFLNTLGIDTRFCNTLYLSGEESSFYISGKVPLLTRSFTLEKLESKQCLPLITG